MSKRRDKSTEPLVSVIVTARDAAAHLEACLDSVTKSTHRNLEVVLVDDGSTDDTPWIIERWANADPRITPHTTPPVGRRAALELAHAEAGGSLQCWVDADDTINPTAIAACVDTIDDEHQLVYTNRNLIDPAGRTIGAHEKNKTLYTPTRLLVSNMIFHLRMFTTDLFEASGGVGEFESAIDWDMNLRMSEHTTPLLIPRTLYNYRIRPGRMSGRPEQVECGQQAVRNAIKRRGLNAELVVDANGWHLHKKQPKSGLQLP